MSSSKLSLCFLIASICLVPSTSSATEPITNANIKTAVDAWIANSSTATTTYGPISDWDVSAVTDMENLFKATNFNDDIGSWNVENVKNMFCMFTDATLFNQDISGWDVSSVTDMQRMFLRASKFDSPIDDWGAHLNPLNIVSLNHLFREAADFNQDLSSWNVSGVTDMEQMFKEATSFNQDLSAWNVSSVTNMARLFEKASAFNQDLGAWGSKLGQVNNLSYIFNGATAFEGTGADGGVSTWDVSSATNMARMFMSADNFNGDIASWVVGEATNMERLFWNATNFNSTLSNWNVGAVTNMYQMFRGATTFNSDLSSWCVPSFSDEPEQFAHNSGLTDENSPVWGTCASDDSGDDDGGDSDGEDGGDDDSGDAPLATMNDFFILEGSGSRAFKTELLTQAISQLNAQLDNSSQVTIMDFLKGKVVNSEVFMEFDLQAIVDAINGESSDISEGDDSEIEDDIEIEEDEEGNNVVVN